MLSVFPDLPTMEWNSKKLMRWNTKVQKSGSGRRKTLSNWAYPEWQLECSYKALTTEHIDQAAGFFGKVRGAAQPFLWKDSDDFRVDRQRVGIWDGASTNFQLFRNVGGLFAEPIRDIIPGTLIVYADDVPIEYTLEPDGIVVPKTATIGAILTASFDYYWRVTFADDDIDWQNFWYGYYKLNKISLVTVK